MSDERKEIMYIAPDRPDYRTIKINLSIPEGQKEFSEDDLTVAIEFREGKDLFKCLQIDDFDECESGAKCISFILFDQMEMCDAERKLMEFMERFGVSKYLITFVKNVDWIKSMEVIDGKIGYNSQSHLDVYDEFKAKNEMKVHSVRHLELAEKYGIDLDSELEKRMDAVFSQFKETNKNS